MTHTNDKLWKTSLALLGFCWLHVPFVLMLAIIRDMPVILPVFASALMAALSSLDLGLSRTRGRITLSCALTAQPAILVGLMAGHPWQVDIHLYFFAMMAILSLLFDVRGLIAAALIVALHHLGLNYALPELIYPGGNSLARTTIHAVILILETVGLCAMVISHHRQKQDVHEAQRRSAETAEAANVRQIKATRQISGVLSATTASASIVQENSARLSGLSDEIARVSRRQSQAVLAASSSIEEIST